MTTEFQVRKGNLIDHRIQNSAVTHDSSVEDGEILLRIDRFAMTANNITYGVMGDRLKYWEFFPPHGDDTDRWGILPVWGFADVISSKTDGIGAGERLYGYFPPADFLKLRPVDVTQRRLVDGSAHRAHLPQGYNLYQRVLHEPGYDSAYDSERALLFPLFITSFCLWDALSAQSWYQSKRVIIISASSKTSIGLAYALAQDEAAPEIVGVTSARNMEMVQKLGLYDAIISYDQVDEIAADIPSVIVDMSGNGPVLVALHSRLGDAMRYSLNVGLTHWDAGGTRGGLIAERSEVFFAPGHIEMRMKEWGPAGFAKRSSDFMDNAAKHSRTWMTVRTVDGLPGLVAVYPDICNGHIAADEGLIVEM